MTKPLYIHGSGCISIQPTFEEGYFFDSVNSYTQNPVPALDPDYKAFIPALQLRRMNKSMRMSLFAAKAAMQQAGVSHVHAVVTGSGLGCLQDSERFVQNLRAEEGQSLNPTPFIQSTHNMAAAALALSLGCKGYNMTYVNNANSFESALLDTMIYLSEHPSATLLLGGVDELGERTAKFWDLAGYLKKDGTAIPTPVSGQTTHGEVVAEGAAFFVVSATAGNDYWGTIRAVETRLHPADPAQWISDFLQRNGLTGKSIHAVMLGCNGDSRYDSIYWTISSALFPAIPQIGFKHILGDYDTVAAASVFLATSILRHQRIPAILRLNSAAVDPIQRILIYSHRRGLNHSLILVEK